MKVKDTMLVSRQQRAEAAQLPPAGHQTLALQVVGVHRESPGCSSVVGHVGDEESGCDFSWVVRHFDLKRNFYFIYRSKLD